MNVFWMIFNENELIYNGGYTHEPTDEIFTKDYGMHFDQKEDALNVVELIVNNCEYLEIRQFYS